jgi:hypothetical protein
MSAAIWIASMPRGYIALIAFVTSLTKRLTWSR